MRKILIPVLILIFCLAALSGCVGGKAWRTSPGLEAHNGFRANKEGCVTFFSNYDYDTEFTWSGACVPTVIDGQTYNLAQGPGTLKVVRLKDGKTVQTYDGEMRNGRYHGRGKAVYYYDDGTEGSYDGDWVDDEREGRGRFVYNDGGIYEGAFKDDQRNGHGRYVYGDGAVYEGEFKDGLREGQGRLVIPGREIYEGSFKNDKRSGWATFYPRCQPANECGSCFNFYKYVGEFKDNYVHGRGTSYDVNGKVIRKGLWFRSCNHDDSLKAWQAMDAGWTARKTKEAEKAESGKEE